MQARKDKDLAEIESQLSKARADLKNASAIVELTDNKDEYDKAGEDVRKAKESITFFNRVKEKKATPLTDTERREIEKELRANHDAITKHYADTIDKKLKDLLSTCAEYDKHVKEYQDAAKICALLNRTNNYQALTFSFNDIGKANASTALSGFITWYAAYLNKINVLNRHGIKYE